MDGFMQLVKDMRAAQKEFWEVNNTITLSDEFSVFEGKLNKMGEAWNRSKALERRVDEEIAAAERQDQTNDPDCIRMANGQTLRQGNLFEDQ